MYKQTLDPKQFVNDRQSEKSLFLQKKKTPRLNKEQIDSKIEAVGFDEVS